MKKIVFKIKKLIILLLIICSILAIIIYFPMKEVVSQNPESIANDIYLEIKNLDTIRDELFKISSKQKNQIELINYIYEFLYLVPPCTGNHTFKYHEYLYNSRIFYDNISDEIEVYSSESLDDGDYDENSEQYYFNENGQISEIILKEDAYYHKGFEYTNRGEIKHIYYSTKTPVLYSNSKNKYQSFGGEKITESLEFFYHKDRLTNTKYSQNNTEFWNIYDKLYYYKSKSNFENKYLFIRSNEELNNCFRVYCFKEGGLKHMFFSFHERYWADDDDFRNNSRIHTIQAIRPNNIEIVIYDFNEDSMVYDLYQTINIEIDNDYLVLNVTIDFHYRPMGGFKSWQYSYKYYFHNSILLKYDVYKSIVDYGTNEKSEFTLEKSFKRLN